MRVTSAALSSVGPAATATSAGPFAALGHRFLVRSDNGLGAATADLFRHLVTASGPTGVTSPTTVYTHRLVDGRHELAADGRLLVRSRTGGRVLEQLVAAVNEGALASCPGPAIHAGAVARGDVGVLLPAPSGAGKTTLVARLLEHGFSYLTDEMVAITAGAMMLPYPKPLSIDPGGWAVLPEYEPPELLRPWCTERWHAAVRAPVVGATQAVRAAIVIRPSYVPGAATTLEEAPRAETLAVLLESAFRADHAALARINHFHLLATLVRDGASYQLIHGDAARAASVISDLVEQRTSEPRP